LAAFVAAVLVSGQVHSRHAARQPFVVGRADDSPSGAVSRAAARVGPAVVRIDRAGQPAQGEGRLPQAGTGSGLIINPSAGYVLTSSQVIRDASNPRVTLADGRIFRARVLGSDPVSDLAVLQIPGRNLPWAPLGRSSRLPIGAWVLVIGNPYGFQSSVSVGVVSAKQRSLGATLVDLIQTDAAINQGNTGGALVNLRGEVVGIATTSYPLAQGIGFAVAIDRAKEVVPQLIAHGKVVRPWIGIFYLEINEDLIAERRLPVSSGLYIQRVVAGGPAQRAGVRDGDIITAAANRPTTAPDDLRLLLRQLKPGDRLPLVVLRGGKRLVLTVVLGEMPQDLPAEAAGQRP
jgi:serine protease Do